MFWWQIFILKNCCYWVDIDLEWLKKLFFLLLFPYYVNNHFGVHLVLMLLILTNTINLKIIQKSTFKNKKRKFILRKDKNAIFSYRFSTFNYIYIYTCIFMLYIKIIVCSRQLDSQSLSSMIPSNVSISTSF